MRWCRDWAAAVCPLVQPLSFVRLSTKSSIPGESLVSLIFCQAQANTSSFPGTSPTSKSQSQKFACWRLGAPTSLKTKSSSSFYTYVRNDEDKCIISRSLDIIFLPVQCLYLFMKIQSHGASPVLKPLTVSEDQMWSSCYYAILPKWPTTIASGGLAQPGQIVNHWPYRYNPILRLPKPKPKRTLKAVKLNFFLHCWGIEVFFCCCQNKGKLQVQ